MKKKLLKLIIPLVVLMLVIMAVPNHYFSDGESFRDSSITTTTTEQGEINNILNLFHTSKKKLLTTTWYTSKTNAVFMEKGKHKFQISYSSSSNNYYEIYSDLDINKDGGKGAVYKIGKLPNTKDKNGEAVEKDFDIACYLPQDVSNLQVKIVHQGDVQLKSVYIYPNRDFDKVWYFIFFAIAIIIVFYLTTIKYQGTGNKNARITIWILVALILYLSLPLMNNFLIYGQDECFHFTRVSGIYESMRDGHLPFFINPKQASLYGYASAVMYPQMFLYIPALLRYFGMSLLNAYKIFLCLINIAGVCISYYSFKKIFSDRKIGMVSCFAYMLSMYFIINQYIRNALGETIAMVFAPLLFLALYEVFLRDYQKWPLLVISFTGILESHVISTYVYGLIAFVIFLLFLPSMRKNQLLKRIIALLKAGILTLLLNAFLLIPFVTLYREPLYVSLPKPMDHVEDFLNTTVYISQLFISKNFYIQIDAGSQDLGTTSHEMPITVGFLTLITLVIFMIIYVLKNRMLVKINEETKKIFKIGMVCFILTVVLLYMTTDLFPWKIIAYLPLLKKLFSIQFSWRLLSPATLFISVLQGCVAYLLYEITTEKLLGLKMLAISNRNIISKVICSVSIAIIAYNSFDLMQELPQRETYANKVEVDGNVFTDEWYLYNGSSLHEIQTRGNFISSSVTNAKIYNCKVKGTTITFSYRLPDDVKFSTFTLPLNYYFNFKAMNNGKAEPTYYDNHHFVVVDVHQNSGNVMVYYKAPHRYMIGYAISEITILASVIVAIIRKKKISKV